MRVAVIGGGPSGLVTLKYLTAAHKHFSIEPIETKLFESADRIGGVFLHHTYEEGEMVSSKFYTAFSDFRLRKDDPDFLPTARYLDYLNDYATHFDLWQHIHLCTTVTAVRRRDDGGHVVGYTTEDGNETEWECDAIAVCSGLHETPNIPEVKGIENVPNVLHSADFKSRSQFGTDSTVMVLGAGETGFDICHLAITGPVKRVIMSHRDGWHGLPKNLPRVVLLPFLSKREDTYENMPIDVAHASLFDTIYVHRRVRDSMIVWNFHDFLERFAGAWLTTGTIVWHQHVGHLPKERNHESSTVFVKSWDRVVEYIEPAWVDQNPGIIERLRRYVATTYIGDAGRYIDIAPWPSHIDKEGVVHFKNSGRPEYERIKNQVIKPDVVIFATGYTQSFSFFKSETNKGRPYPVAHDANVRNIWVRDDPTLGFIGFTRPGLGAIPSLSEMQAMLWIQNLLGEVTEPLLPEDEYHYRILTPPTARVQWGVEHESYAYQLAKDINGAPSVAEVLEIAWNRRAEKNVLWKLPIIWAAAANVNAKFRMRGPWAWDGAVENLTTEIWETIRRRRGFFGHMFLAVTPIMILGSFSLISLMLEIFSEILTAVGLKAKKGRRKVMPHGEVVYEKTA